MSPKTPVCMWCSRFDPDGDFVCAAYPEGIPKGILEGAERHDEPRQGDHGLQWSPRTPTSRRDLIEYRARVGLE